jgi:adenylyl-sulfate kinase
VGYPSDQEIIVQSGFTLWFTGMSGSGKSTLSKLIEETFLAAGGRVELLDGDDVRTNLCRGLGFSREDRRENIRRIGFVCELLSRNGVMAIAAAISPYRADRDEVRGRIRNFVEVYMSCPLEVLIQRDVKGLYRKALAGDIKHFTGISDPYEPPVAAEVTIDSASETVEQSAVKVMTRLEELGLISVQRTFRFTIPAAHGSAVDRGA